MNDLKNELYEFVKSDSEVFHFLQDYAMEGICFVDLNDFTRYWCSKKLELSLGYLENEVHNRFPQLNSIIHPEDIDFFKKEIPSQLNADKHTFDANIRLLSKGGLYLEVEAHVLYVFRNDSGAERLLIFFKKISNNDELNQSLKKLNAHLVNLVSGSGDLIFVLSKNLDYIEYYGSNENMIIPPSEFIGKNFLELKYQEPAFSKVHKSLLNCLAKGFSTVEYSLDIKGKEHWYKLDCRLFRNESKDDDEILCVSTDITELKDKENQLRELLIKIKLNEERMELALEGSGNGIWDWDLESKHVYYSRQWKALLGYEDHEITNSPREWEKRIHPDDIKKCYSELENHLTGKTAYYSNEHRLLCKDGSYKWVLDRGKVIEYTALGKPKRMVGTKSDITERKKSELELFNSKQIIESLFSNLPGIAYRCLPDDNWTMILISKEVKKITGYSHTDFINNKVRTFASIIHPDDVELIKNSIGNSVGGNSTYELEYRLIGSKGQVIWVRERGNGIYNSQGKLMFLDGIIFDISERRQVKETLIRTRKLLEQAGNLAKVGWWEVDIVNSEIIWSDVTRKIHEVDASFVPDFNNALQFYKEGRDRDTISKHFENAIKKGMSYECELKIITAKGREIWIKTVGTPVFIDGKLVRLYGSFQDIDEIRKNNIKLQNFEILQKLTNSVPGVVYQFEQRKNRKYAYTFVSDNVENIHKDINKEIVLSNPEKTFSLIHPADKERFLRSMQKASRNLTDWKCEYRVICSDGSIVWHQGHSKPEKLEDGTVVWYGYIHNITEYKELQQKLQEKVTEVLEKNSELEQYIAKNKELERFAYIVSHDLKEPLRTIKAFSEIIKSKYMPQLDENALTYFEFIISSSERMTSLIEGILEYSKIDENSHPSELIDVNDLIEKVMLDLNSSITESNAEIIFENLSAVYCNPVQIRQLFQNILSNAIKFSSKNNHPKVVITSEERENDVLFAISDNGIGISKENFDTIFSMFKRLHSRDSYRGHGVGLALCKRIVEKHQGEIWVESDGTNGTTFFISLPRKTLVI